MLQVIINGEIYGPEAGGAQTITIAGGSILHIGSLDMEALRASDLPYKEIDAGGCIITPGLIDPHEHLIGGSGEEGFATQTPEIAFSELVRGGITTVVGCLGTDTVTKTMEALVAKTKGLRQQGLTAYAWTGGYDVPPATLTGSLKRDLLFVEELIGTGELAISDRRSSAPVLDELARVVKQTYVAGTLTAKAGVTHFHVGEEPSALELLRALLDQRQIHPDSLYATHITRNAGLMREAIELTRRGCTVDIDTVDGDLPRWLRFFVSNGGDLTRLTVSSDAALNSPASVLQQISECVRQNVLGLGEALSLCTRNAARVLKLGHKGVLKSGADADLLLLRKEDLSLRYVWARGACLLEDGVLRAQESYLAGSKRRLELHGQKT